MKDLLNGTLMTSLISLQTGLTDVEKDYHAIIVHGPGCPSCSNNCADTCGKKCAGGCTCLTG